MVSDIKLHQQQFCRIWNADTNVPAIAQSNYEGALERMRNPPVTVLTLGRTQPDMDDTLHQSSKRHQL